MNTHSKSELMFYFVWDDMIVIKSNNYYDVLEEATLYFNEFGEKHTYNLYSVNKYDFKEMLNLKEC